jgi:hypothetical protein
VLSQRATMAFQHTAFAASGRLRSWPHDGTKARHPVEKTFCGAAQVSRSLTVKPTQFVWHGAKKTGEQVSRSSATGKVTLTGRADLGCGRCALPVQHQEDARQRFPKPSGSRERGNALADSAGLPLCPSGHRRKIVASELAKRGGTEGLAPWEIGRAPRIIRTGGWRLQ